LGNDVHIKRMLKKLADLDRVEGGKACLTKKMEAAQRRLRAALREVSGLC
jgi:hypothetical protein